MAGETLNAPQRIGWSLAAGTALGVMAAGALGVIDHFGNQFTKAEVNHCATWADSHAGRAMLVDRLGPCTFAADAFGAEGVDTKVTIPSATDVPSVIKSWEQTNHTDARRLEIVVLLVGVLGGGVSGAAWDGRQRRDSYFVDAPLAAVG